MRNRFLVFRLGTFSVFVCFVMWRKSRLQWRPHPTIWIWISRRVAAVARSPPVKVGRVTFNCWVAPMLHLRLKSGWLNNVCRFSGRRPSFSTLSPTSRTRNWTTLTTTTRRPSSGCATWASSHSINLFPKAGQSLCCLCGTWHLSHRRPPQVRPSWSK